MAANLRHTLKPWFHIPLVERILLDTNFLLSQFEYGLDLRSELLRVSDGPVTLVLPSKVMDEIKSLSGKTGRRAMAARFALQNFGKFKEKFAVETVESFGPVDGWIIKYAQKNKICVATNDVELRRRLMAVGARVLAIKSKSKLGYV
jgi:rRNA-processing protein FCF1